MQRAHDERAKLIAEQMLDPLGDIEREQEVRAADAQRVDLRFIRRFFPAVLPMYLLLLDRLFSADCLIEVFSGVVGVLEFWASQRKQLGWQHERQQAAEKATGKSGVVLVPLPWMWIISAGRPRALFDLYDIRPKAGFDGGVYEFPRGMQIGLVVLSELPVSRQTLLLRLMGTGEMLEQAVAELHGVPAADPEAEALRRFAACLRHTIDHATNVPQEERAEVMTKVWADFERWERETLEKGEERGIKKGEERGIKKGEEEALKKAIGELKASAVQISRQRFGEDQLGEMRITRLQSMEALTALVVRLATAPTLAQALSDLPAD